MCSSLPTTLCGAKSLVWPTGWPLILHTVFPCSSHTHLGSSIPSDVHPCFDPAKAFADLCPGGIHALRWRSSFTSVSKWPHLTTQPILGICFPCFALLLPKACYTSLDVKMQEQMLDKFHTLLRRLGHKEHELMTNLGYLMRLCQKQ